MNFWLSLSEEKNLENLGNFENFLEPFFPLLDLGIFYKYMETKSGNEILLHKEHSYDFEYSLFRSHIYIDIYGSFEFKIQSFNLAFSIFTKILLHSSYEYNQENGMKNFDLPSFK